MPTFAFFSSENEISIQLAALWTPQVPRFHRCKPFKKTHLKKIANGFFQILCCQGDDQLQPQRLFVYRGRSEMWGGARRYKKRRRQKERSEPINDFRAHPRVNTVGPEVNNNIPTNVPTTTKLHHPPVNTIYQIYWTL